MPWSHSQAGIVQLCLASGREPRCLKQETQTGDAVAWSVCGHGDGPRAGVSRCAGLPSGDLYWPEGVCPRGLRGICDEPPLPPRELTGEGTALQERLLTLAQAPPHRPKEKRGTSGVTCLAASAPGEPQTRLAVCEAALPSFQGLTARHFLNRRLPSAPPSWPGLLLPQDLCPACPSLPSCSCNWFLSFRSQPREHLLREAFLELPTTSFSGKGPELWPAEMLSSCQSRATPPPLLQAAFRQLGQRGQLPSGLPTRNRPLSTLRPHALPRCHL